MPQPPQTDPAQAQPGVLRRRLLLPLLSLLREGASPSQLAWSLALGVAVGVFPIFGLSTLICMALCLLLRLNQPASQIANQLMYLVQLPMMLVFVRLGERIAGAPTMPFTPAELLAELRADPALFLVQFGATAGHGILGWVLVAPALAVVVYLIAHPILRAMSARRARVA